MFPIMDALIYINSKRIFHGDVEVGNILISFSGEPKLCNFRESRVLRKKPLRCRQWFGTEDFMPPEIFRCMEYDATADTWSFAISMLFLLRGAAAHRCGWGYASYFYRVSDPNDPEDQEALWSDYYLLPWPAETKEEKEWKDFVRGLLVYNRRKRKPLKVFPEHQLVKKYRKAWKKRNNSTVFLEGRSLLRKKLQEKTLKLDDPLTTLPMPTYLSNSEIIKPRCTNMEKLVPKHQKTRLSLFFNFCTFLFCRNFMQKTRRLLYFRK